MSQQLGLVLATAVAAPASADPGIDAQEREIAQMSHWLRDWYSMEPPAGMEMPMASMMSSMAMMHGAMPNMTARMDKLKELSGAAFDVEFLSTMAHGCGPALIQYMTTAR